jgi:predicted Zn-dependent protease
MVDPKNLDYTFGYILAKRHLGDYHAHHRDLAQAEAYYQSAIELCRSTLQKRADSDQGQLLLASQRTELAELLVESDTPRSKSLIVETSADLEHWLSAHQNSGEGWLYLAQARTNQYLIVKRSGETASAEVSKSAAYTAITRLSQGERKKFAIEIDELLNKLE